jgi:PAS domain S-box-containing protein
VTTTVPRSDSLGFYTRLRLALVGGYAVVAVGICGAAIWYTLRDQEERFATAAHNTSTLLRALDEHVRRAFGAVDVLLAEVAADLVAAGGVTRVAEAQLHRGLRVRQALLPQTRALFVYGPDSILYADTAKVPAMRLDGSTYEHVLAHRRGVTSSLHVGQPILSKVSGLWAIPVTRRIPSPGDGFGGAVGAILEQKHFDAFYRDLGLSPGQGFALFRADGIIIFRFPETAGLKPGVDMSSTSPIFSQGARLPEKGTLRFVSAMDGVERIVAFRRIPDLALVVTLSQETEEILAAWRRNTAAVAIGVAGALAALSVLLWIAMRQIRRQAADEVRLRDAEEQYRSLVELAPIGIARHERGVIQYANPEFARIVGAGAPGELVGQSASRFIHPDDSERSRARLETLDAAPGRTEPALFRVQRDDGTEAIVESQAVSSRQDDRMLVQLMVRDVTAEQLAAAEVQRLNETLEEQVRSRTAELKAANVELEAFSYSVSHDLRAPLRAIAGFSEILRAEHAAALPPDALALLERSEAAAKRMGQLIDNLLGLARVSRQDMHKARVELSALAAEIAAELAEASPAREVEVRVAPGLSARADPALIRVALQNLLANAWKYTARSAQARVEFGAELSGAERVFYVRDNGAGFDMQYAEQLFRPFQRLHNDYEYEGTGIGLATVERIIRRHGGRVWAEAAPERGATFRFTLP